ncbi:MULTISPECIES: outer membrane protein assembly factor BamE [Acinetobacter]|jgi:outer membrane protein assembly factor BamE|uniref:outer membrane protein assembly factor BamE n=1 Tax=Acinetobacter TaxID=469 RepID=UPI000DAEEC85|nr:outer membrane protein assembly factor BamE [Acinetobacter radioresistens]AWV87109.1 outer membrane protein assembly factor BamE [Acinetobacter radioresistens]MCK4081374.1 outer membrane protein assembly factor BamE [Acinetobacter radioresistens]MCK4090789.1 outer membrane protein assembly factor BamE [Acinetobacter radioresistens]MCU4307993.1 outer membrane protein assembly factor BamE [Acinetobacter radioresistens]MCX0329087.1 outer membrane protein assembly factor BamE [Acinetobacter rad
MQKLMLTLVVISLLVGCSTLGVYKVDIPQGTPLTQAQASKVQVGMSHQQVRFLLGSPTVTDPLNPLRWDYIYNYIPGTYAKKAKIPAAHGQHLKIYFNETGIVTKIEGLETIPESQPGLPASREAILNAPPL